MMRAASSIGVGVQGSFDDLGTGLQEVTFVVVDLETTGGSSTNHHITEIGAVKVRGGEVLGEFQSLVQPPGPIPAFITVLTGITDAMVARAPQIDTVLPAFLEFAAGSVLVAHNAGFDIGFLKAAAARAEHPWPGFTVLDTVRLGRQLVPRDETPNHRLESLARVFGSPVVPNHRALEDARATVAVLHGLIGRVGNLGVATLEELQSYTGRVSVAQRRKRFLAESMPTAPGVYVFVDDAGTPLYVGTAGNLRRRTMSYFTASETRSRMAEMVGLATAITPIVCPTAIEAQVRELRLITEHQPRYNRRSRRDDRTLWIRLTDEPFPRLSVVRRRPPEDAPYAGPFSSRAAAQDAVAAIHEVLPLRQCTTRLSRTPSSTGSACALAELGRCGGPCVGSQSVADYAPVAARAAALLTGDGAEVMSALRSRMAELAAAERFEQAQLLRDRMICLVRAVSRSQRLAPLIATEHLTAARPASDGGWEVICVRFGRLAGTTLAPRGVDPMPAIRAMEHTAEVVTPGPDGAGAALPTETELVLRWLEKPGVRLVDLRGGSWTCPVGGADRTRVELEEMARRWREQPLGRAG